MLVEGQGEADLELVVCWQDEIRSIPLPRAGELDLGRAEENHVRLEYPTVSRRHAVLRLAEPLSIEDLGSVNGTFVRDPAPARHGDETLNLRQLVRKRADIAVGDMVMLGSVTVVVRRRAPTVTPPLPSENAHGAESLPTMQSPLVKSVYEQAARAARSTISVLVLGETGVGKELLARAVHAHSPRAKKPFMGINCAALSESLLEGELFGHEKGAFTGAHAAAPGLLEAAEGGSVFLDEVGELPLATQAKLLRVLSEGAVRRLGSRSLRNIDVRFIAATNRELSLEVAAGRFRKDLYFRLNGISLTLPPLRERPEEIEPLARAFMARACWQLERKTPTAVPKAVMDLLRCYSWPGNVRELKNVIERAAVLCAQGALCPADLPQALLTELQPASSTQRASDKAASSIGAGASGGSASSSMHQEIRSLERSRIISALGQCAGNQTQAARLLGISRRTLTTRLAEFELPRPRRPREVRE